jgi:hypothetical protein
MAAAGSMAAAGNGPVEFTLLHLTAGSTPAANEPRKTTTTTTTYYLLLTTCYLLLATCYLLLATYYLLLTTCYLLLATYYLLLLTNYYASGGPSFCLSGLPDTPKCMRLDPTQTSKATGS